jgi:hypothetical protein
MVMNYAEADRLPIPEWVRYHELLTAEEILKQESIFQKGSREWIFKFYEELEKRNLQDIADIGHDIGLMIKVRETFKEDKRIPAYCHYFINIYQCEIEELYGEIGEYREFRKRLQAG